MKHRARKRFGQNFLHDGRVIQNIINVIAAKEGDHIVEIGPGKGALTEYILPVTKEIDVVELDRDLIPILSKNCGALGELRVHNADALKFDFSTLRKSEEKLRVVGNLPYNISTPLIFHLIENAPLIEDMHFMLQKEVVDRMAATPGTKDYGKLSVMVQYRCKVDCLFIVDPSAFDPIPKVDSAIVRLVPYDELPIKAKDEAQLEKVVTAAFAQRRKTLRNNMKGIVTAEQLEQLGIDPAIRAERLTITEFISISDFISDQVNG